MKSVRNYYLKAILFSVLNVFIACCGLVTTSIDVQAATANCSFTDSRSAQLVMQCPGSYYCYNWENAHDMDDSCLSQHYNGCGCNDAYCSRPGSK